MQPPAMSIGSQLCTSCGLCCTGALHDIAALDEDEVAAAQAVGLEIVEAAGRFDFALPCPRLEGTRCGIYPDRPRVCGRYRCKLLSDVEDGKLASVAALEVVATAREAGERALSHLPSGETLASSRRRLLKEVPELPSVARLHLTALLAYLDRHFRSASDGRLLGTQSVTSTGHGGTE